MKLLAQGRLAAVGCLVGFLLLAAGRFVPTPELSIGLTALGAVGLVFGLVSIRSFGGNVQELLTDLEARQTTKK